uniref:Uncharacterized protein n=1 Tax=Yersinia enterocolitica TaxID=630 RepID=B0RL61_YEREN|nr:hypothetical protein [Yersinia enterocolitica]
MSAWKADYLMTQVNDPGHPGAPELTGHSGSEIRFYLRQPWPPHRSAPRHQSRELSRCSAGARPVTLRPGEYLYRCASPSTTGA